MGVVEGFLTALGGRLGRVSHCPQIHQCQRRLGQGGGWLGATGPQSVEQEQPVPVRQPVVEIAWDRAGEGPRQPYQQEPDVRERHIRAEYPGGVRPVDQLLEQSPRARTDRCDFLVVRRHVVEVQHGITALTRRSRARCM